MKKLYSLLMVLAMIVSFSACGDSKPDDLPVSIQASALKSLKLVASEGAETTLELTFNKSDFAALEKYEKWVNSGQVQTSTYIQFANVAEGVELSNVKLSLASNSKTVLELGTVSNNDTLDDLPNLNFLQNVVNEVSGRGSSTLRLTFKTNSTIVTPVDFTIKLDAKFSF